jgi:hypothetical protein
MDGNEAIKQERRALKRNIVLLFALAVIAQRGSVLPAPLRYLLLSVLFRAAPVAMNYVITTGPVTFDTGDTVDDLLFLAELFRTAGQTMTWMLNALPDSAGGMAEPELLDVARLISCNRRAMQHWLRISQRAANRNSPGFDTS